MREEEEETNEWTLWKHLQRMYTGAFSVVLPFEEDSSGGHDPSSSSSSSSSGHNNDPSFLSSSERFGNNDSKSCFFLSTSPFHSSSAYDHKSSSSSSSGVVHDVKFVNNPSFLSSAAPPIKKRTRTSSSYALAKGSSGMVFCGWYKNQPIVIKINRRAKRFASQQKEYQTQRTIQSFFQHHERYEEAKECLSFVLDHSVRMHESLPLFAFATPWYSCTLSQTPYPLQRWSNETSVQVHMQQLILGCFRCLELLHLSGHVHRDVSAGNFALEWLGSQNEYQTPSTLFRSSQYEAVVHLIDYGMARSLAEYYSPDKKSTARPATTRNKRPVGTLLYSSADITNRCTPRYEDDVESVLFVLTKLWKGGLPWERLCTHLSPSSSSSTFRRIVQCKQMVELPGYLGSLLQLVRAHKASTHPSTPLPYAQWIQHIVHASPLPFSCAP